MLDFSMRSASTLQDRHHRIPNDLARFTWGTHHGRSCASCTRWTKLLAGKCFPFLFLSLYLSLRLFFCVKPTNNCLYSQTCELRPPKGLGISGFISPVVSFARFGSKFFNMESYTYPCASHLHQRSVVPTCMRGRNWL